MADAMIEIGFAVGNDDLEAGLSQAVQDFTATSAAIRQGFDDIAQSAKAAALPFVGLQESLEALRAPPATQKKALDDIFAAQASQVEMLKSLNLISADDAIAQQTRIENDKFDGLKRQLDAENDAAGVTKAVHEKLQNELDDLQVKHNTKARELDKKAVDESLQSWKSIIAPIGSAFESSLNGIIQGHETLRQAVAKIGQSIVSDFTNMAVKRATDWIASELTMTSGTEAGAAARRAAQMAADAAGKASNAAAGSVSIVGDANKAAAGAYSAVAGIPIVGPVLAPAAAVAAFTAVMAYDVFSAEGGFDIPAGLNPVTQLHEREMVLPASIADPLRAGLTGGGKAGGDIHIHAVDAASFQRLLSNNKGALAKALRGAHRAFDPALA